MYIYTHTCVRAYVFFDFHTQAYAISLTFKISEFLFFAVDLKGKMTMGVVQKDDKGVCGRFKVTKFPQVCTQHILGT